MCEEDHLHQRTADVRQVSQSYVLQVGGAQSPQNAVYFGYVAGLVELYVNQVTGDDPQPISAFSSRRT